MAKQRFKGALNTATFPLVSILQSRTVVNPQLDINTRKPPNPNGTEDSTDYSIPQISYCENVVPTAEGVQSVGYREVIPGLSDIIAFDQMIILRDAAEKNYLLSPAGGGNYLFDKTVGSWNKINTISSFATVTRAYVNGRTFVCYDGLGIYEYDPATKLLVLQVLVGITNAEVHGIGSSSNYLLAYTDLTVYWSSLVNPLDFVPSLTTGAGFAIPQDVKAKITAILGISGGYIVYTAKNAVAAVYTNNSRSPFTFKEISNAGGIYTYEQVTSEQNSGPHYAWTTGGLQKITIQGAEAVSAEVNDFIAGKLWESYDPVTHKLTQHYADTAEFPVKLAYLSSRWLIISYRTLGAGTSYNYALLYDTILRRWGKLKLDHVDCFFYPYATVVNSPESATSKLSLGFLRSDGQVVLATMDYNKTVEHNAVLVLGKFQLVRGQVMTLQQLDLEGLYRASNSSTNSVPYVQTELDGYTPEATLPLVLLRGTAKAAKYAKRVTGINFNILLEGTFALSSYLLEVTQDGDR